MKRFLLFLLVIISISACTSQKEINRSDANSEKGGGVTLDTTEYAIQIIDNDFDRWYMMRFSPAVDRTNDYYRTKNQIGVANWNDYFIRNKYRRAIANYLSFNPLEDYGIEVNRKLYWYFKFVEETYGIRLLN